MKRTMLGTLLVAVLTCTLPLLAPSTLQAVRCCDNAGYSTSQYWVMKPTCSEAQSAFRSAAMPEAQAVCDPEFVCATQIPGCYPAYDEAGNLMYVVDGWMYFGCTYDCECSAESSSALDTSEKIQVSNQTYESLAKAENLSAISTFEKVQLWNRTFESLAKTDGLTEEQRAVLQTASKLGTFSYFEAKMGTAAWKIKVQATSNAILEAAFQTLPANLYGAVWSRFQLAPGASQFATVTPICNCVGFGTACTVGTANGICARVTCKNCGMTGLCSVP